MNKIINEKRKIDEEVSFSDPLKGDFLGTTDNEFNSFVEKMPDTYWAKYDLSAVRLGWEAAKVYATT